MGRRSLPTPPPPSRRLPAQQVGEATLTCGPPARCGSALLLPRGSATASPSARPYDSIAAAGKRAATGPGWAVRRGGRWRPAPRLVPVGGAAARPAPGQGRLPLTCARLPRGGGAAAPEGGGAGGGVRRRVLGAAGRGLWGAGGSVPPGGTPGGEETRGRRRRRREGALAQVRRHRQRLMKCGATGGCGVVSLRG